MAPSPNLTAPKALRRSQADPSSRPALGVDSTTGASIETNKDDYTPGEVVHLVGRGWAPGETVNLSYDRKSGHARRRRHERSWRTALVASASTIYDVQPHDLGVTFTLTATGSTSNSVAVAVFTDNVPVTSFTLNGSSAVTVAPSASINAVVGGVVNGGGSSNTLGSIAIRSHVDGTASTTSVQLVCHNVTPDVVHVSGAAIAYSEAFTVNAPPCTGTYEVFAASYGNSTCTGTPVATLTLDNGIVVAQPNTAPTLKVSHDGAIHTGTGSLHVRRQRVGSLTFPRRH